MYNRSSTTPLRDTTPYTLWFRRKLVVSHFRVFRCTAYMHIKKDQRTGLQAHTQKCIFIGYSSEYKGWLFYNPDTKKTIISNAAEFDERLFPGLS